MTEDLHFRIATANQNQLPLRYSNPSLSAVNAVALAGELSWEDSFRILLEQSKRYGAMPERMECVWNMFPAAGYVRVKPFKHCYSWADLSDYMMKKFPQVTHAVIRINLGNSHSPRFCAVRRLPDPSDGFVVMDTRMFDPQIVALFLDYRETGDPKPEPAPPPERAEKTSESHRSYLYYQPNPRKRNVDDCVIRAYSGFFNLSWGDALDLVARATEYQTTILNSYRVCYIPATLYESHLDIGLKCDATGRTIREFCDLMTLRCHDGQRFYVQAGRSHAVAIIPTVIDGVPQYAAADSWDSSGWRISRCWVFRPTRKEPKSFIEKPSVDKEVFRVGTRLRHPTLGPCRILAVDINEGRIVLSFSSGEEKELSLSWVVQKCEPETQPSRLLHDE